MILNKRFVHWLQVEESGQGMVEYVFITMLIAIVVVGSLKLLGTSLKDIFEEVKIGLG